MLESLFNKVSRLQGLQLQEVFPCEYFKIFKKIYFEKHLQMAASRIFRTPDRCSFHKYLYHHETQNTLIKYFLKTILLDLEIFSNIVHV